MSDELVAFMWQQLDDDERVAREAQRGPWTMRDRDGSTPWTDIDAADGTVTSSYDGECVAVKDAEHIVRWDPARVLAETETKRRILAHIGMVVLSPGREALPPEYVAQMELFLRWLAQPYAGRDGWREEWRT